MEQRNVTATSQRDGVTRSGRGPRRRWLLHRLALQGALRLGEQVDAVHKDQEACSGDGKQRKEAQGGSVKSQGNGQRVEPHFRLASALTNDGGDDEGPGVVGRQAVGVLLCQHAVHLHAVEAVEHCGNLHQAEAKAGDAAGASGNGARQAKGDKEAQPAEEEGDCEAGWEMRAGLRGV